MVRATRSSTESTAVTRTSNARAPDIAPAFGAIFFARADVDILADVDRAARRQVVGVEAGGGNGRRSMLVCRPVKAVVKRISSALLATSIALYLASAMLSFVAMNLVPI